MPLVMLDIVQGRTADQIAAILDAAPAAMLESFGVPARDRYQIINEHEPYIWSCRTQVLSVERTKDITIGNCCSAKVRFGLDRARQRPDRFPP